MARTAPAVVQSFATDTPRRYRRVLVAAFLALIAGIGSIGFFYLRRQLADSRLTAQQELSAIADLKVERLLTALREIKPLDANPLDLLAATLDEKLPGLFVPHAR